MVLTGKTEWHRMVLPTYLLWLAAGFDFLDGFAARLLKVNSEIGKELDSLADVITFGLLPATMMYALIKASSENNLLPYVAFAIAAFSALRLAKFNIDERQTTSFIGLPTPPNGLFLSALPIIYFDSNQAFGGILGMPVVLVIICIVFSLILVSEIPFFSLKLKGLAWSENKVLYPFLIVSLALLFWLKVVAIPLIIIAYILLSILLKITKNEL